ncbi:MAG: 50S ribosome-binding GTPase [Lachnospiraceae bacterium]|nr:50S ribosome-binding GTPase [Lachnospiraceae bacterium]
MLSEMFKNIGDSLEDMIKSAEAGEGSIRDNMVDFRDILECEIKNGKLSDEDKETLLERLDIFCDTETNIMLVGSTGCGKSSTINALFSVGEGLYGDNKNLEDDDEEFDDETVVAGKKPYVEIAKVGSDANPETKDIEKYKIGNLVLWDTPGLGDDTEADEHNREIISELLARTDDGGNALIDLVIVILDGSTKDFKSTYEIINDVIVPGLEDEVDRILIAINQADIAMKTGRHWDYEKNEPDKVLLDYLENKVESVKERIHDESGLEVHPIYYCAGYVEEDGDVVRPYNLSKLLYYILEGLPSNKRIAVMEGINTDSNNYEFDDGLEDYNDSIKTDFYDAFDYISDGVDTGVEIGGTILGIPGALVGAVLGGFVGCVRTVVDQIFD